MSTRRRSRGKPQADSDDETSGDVSPSKTGPSKRKIRQTAELEDTHSSSDSPLTSSPPKKARGARTSEGSPAKVSPVKRPKGTKTPTVSATAPESEPQTEVNEPDEEMRGDFEEEDTHSDEEGGIRIGDIFIPPPPPATTGVDLSGPRLIITQIVNENFKSYAGKTTLGPFHKCFTSIVGPNGSGKSNVIDSMLFVFGYRATKIRSKKISVLLHNSDEHKNVQSCTVAVHFKLIIDKVRY